MMEIYKNTFLRKPKTISYWRNPTKEDIKFGYGAIHYRDFDFDTSFDKNNLLIPKAQISDDGLIYYYTGRECSNTSKYKVQTISIL